MQQQINLFQPVFRKERKIFSALTLSKIAGLVLLLLFTTYAYFQANLLQLQSAETRLRDQVADLKSQLERLEVESQSPELETLNEQIESLTLELSSKQNIAQQFGSLLETGNQGFADRLEALTELSARGLWLTGVSIQNQGTDMILQGTALAPDLVPRYLERLPGKPALRPLQFRSVQLVRQIENPGQLDFLLRTDPALEFGTEQPSNGPGLLRRINGVADVVPAT